MTADYESLRTLARDIYNDAVEAHQVVWRGDQVFESFDETPLGEAIKTFNEACILLAQFSADAGAMMKHRHAFPEADVCTVCGYDRRPGR